jgi:hypothetical protein
VTTIKHTITGAARGTGSAALTVTGAVVIGGGIPLFWVWAASMIAGDDRHVTTALAIFLAVGILVSYWLALLAAGILRDRWVGPQQTKAKLRRMSWNRSFRDEPIHHGEEKLDPIERMFILMAVIGFIAFEIWFAFFAGSPLAGYPGA